MECKSCKFLLIKEIKKVKSVGFFWGRTEFKVYLDWQRDETAGEDKAKAAKINRANDSVRDEKVGNKEEQWGENEVRERKGGQKKKVAWGKAKTCT